MCVTFDADFHAILALSAASNPSVIRVRIEGLDGAALAGLLLRSWPSIAVAVEAGAMVTIRSDSIRVRRLPIVAV